MSTVNDRGFATRLSPRPYLATLCLLVCLLAVSPAPARAEPSTSPLASPNLLFAENVSWYGFTKYWKNYGNRADRIVLIVALIGGLAFFIIMRGGKWR